MCCHITEMGENNRDIKFVMCSLSCLGWLGLLTNVHINMKHLEKGIETDMLGIRVLLCLLEV